LLNPIQVDQEIDATLVRLDELVEAIHDSAATSSNCEAEFKLAYAKQRLEIRATSDKKLTVDQVEDEALVACEQLYRRHMIASGSHDALRDAMFATRAKLDALRTRSASVRELVR
jgi:hypothetical protein